jgi:Fe-S cluster assembly protein SufD
MNAVVAPPAGYREAFDAVAPAGHAGVDAARAAAYARFETLGFPGAREEAWKYTSLRRLATRRFAPTTGRGSARPDPARALHLRDGRLLGAPAMPPGVRLRTLAAALDDGEPVAALLRVPSGGGTERFAALNAALAADALLLEVDEGARVDGDLGVLVEATGAGAMSHPRLIVRLARGATIRLSVEYVGDGEERFVNACLDLEVGPDARLELCRLQSHGDRTYAIERIDATLGQRARFSMHDATLGAAQARLDLNVRLAAPGASVEAHGLFLADGTHHHDTHVLVDHLAPATSSLMHYRGIAAGRGRGIWVGKAVVHPGAQGANARQSSRNLLLETGAEIDTRPELEIYADDVQCSHGATTGQLDPAAMFYLRSRGLDEATARAVLTRAFAAPVLSAVEDGGWARAVHALLDGRLAMLVGDPS